MRDAFQLTCQAWELWDSLSCSEYLAALALLILSGIGLAVSLVALLPAYREDRDTRGELSLAKKAQLHKLLESLHYQTRRIFAVHSCFFVFHVVMVAFALYALLIPPVPVPYAEARALHLTTLLLCLKPFSLAMQVMLWQMTTEQRNNRRELAAGE